eukprot:351631-Chlamydomonas_euryale.AAC.1
MSSSEPPIATAQAPAGDEDEAAEARAAGAAETVTYYNVAADLLGCGAAACEREGSPSPSLPRQAPSQQEPVSTRPNPLMYYNAAAKVAGT